MVGDCVAEPLNQTGDAPRATVTHCYKLACAERLQ
jgi:hypothetical protein